MATSFSGGRYRSTRGEPPTMGKQQVNFITCAASRVPTFCNLQSWARTDAVLVIGLYELLGNPTTYLIEPDQVEIVVLTSIATSRDSDEL